ncbi:MAG TPA: ABC transporter ATP-binding protein [Solirubrobacteraceae bacterium]|nr:ABC transporter ATP-binding protein [Solirubrobacteraceae bacterium]
MVPGARLEGPLPRRRTDLRPRQGPGRLHPELGGQLTPLRPGAEPQPDLTARRSTGGPSSRGLGETSRVSGEDRARPPAIRARGIVKSFGEVIALDRVDLDVAPGQVHGLVGPNGAGKTTLLALCLGLAQADAGELEILGCPVRRRLALPAGVAGFVDGPGLYPSLTARQNLAALARLRGDHAQGVDDALDRVGLTDVADDRVRGFSLGMRQRLGLGAALLSTPRLLVLDEPANGLDPAGTRHVHRVLNELAAGGTSIVLSSHRMDDLAALCSDITLLARGRVAFSGPVAALAAGADALDYRLRTSDPAAARRVAGQTPGVRILPGEDHDQRQAPGALLVRGAVPALDALVAGLIGAGVWVRELAPVMPPLEAAFLALTAAADANRDEQP